MRNGYRHPLAGIVIMVLLFAVIALFFTMTGNLAPFGRGVLMLISTAGLGACVVVLLLFALHRAGTQRLEQVRTWPQN